MMKLTVVCLFIIAICVIAAQECQQGDTKREDCNSCRCTNGVWACTKRACIRKREALDANNEVAREKREVPGADVLATTPCAPNDYFTLDCNVCYCKTDRTGYLCTDNNCSDEAWALRTTTHIPISNDSMLIMSNYGVELIENLNSNDNSISRIAKSLESQTLSHETVDPEVVDLETVDSKTVDPKTVDSKTVDSETVDSESVDSKTVDSKIVDPETVDPKIIDPKSGDSKSIDSETVDDETLDDQTVEPETIEPETVKPETFESETVEPENVETKTVEPENVGSETVEPEIVKSATVEPETAGSVTVKNEPVVTESEEPSPKSTERKSSPRSPLIIASEQRRTDSLRNQSSD